MAKTSAPSPSIGKTNKKSSKTAEETYAARKRGILDAPEETASVGDDAEDNEAIAIAAMMSADKNDADGPSLTDSATGFMQGMLLADDNFGSMGSGGNANGYSGYRNYGRGSKNQKGKNTTKNGKNTTSIPTESKPHETVGEQKIRGRTSRGKYAALLGGALAAVGIGSLAAPSIGDMFSGNKKKEDSLPESPEITTSPDATPVEIPTEGNVLSSAAKAYSNSPDLLKSGMSALPMLGPAMTSMNLLDKAMPGGLGSCMDALSGDLGYFCPFVGTYKTGVDTYNSIISGDPVGAGVNATFTVVSGVSDGLLVGGVALSAIPSGGTSVVAGGAVEAGKTAALAGARQGALSFLKGGAKTGAMDAVKLVESGSGLEKMGSLSKMEKISTVADMSCNGLAVGETALNIIPNNVQPKIGNRLNEYQSLTMAQTNTIKMPDATPAALKNLPTAGPSVPTSAIGQFGIDA